MSEALNILIVEPEAAEAKRLSQALASLKAKVRVAHNGQEAILFTGKSPPELIITELDLPMLNGIEVCRFLKTKFADHTLPILAVASRHDAGVREEAAMVGCDELLGKPVDPQVLEATAKGLIELGRAENALNELEQRFRDDPDAEKSGQGERAQLVERVCRVRVETARRLLARGHSELAEAHVDRVARLAPDRAELRELRTKMEAKP